MAGTITEDTKREGQKTNSSQKPKKRERANTSCGKKLSISLAASLMSHACKGQKVKAKKRTAHKNQKKGES
jgi:hypothetical protein